MVRRISLAVTAAIVFALCATGAAAAAGGNGHGPIRGIIPSRGEGHGQAHGGGGGKTGSSNLIFHGGPVLNGGNAVYAIFWSPSNWSTPIRSSYEQLIERYFGDVAAATNTSPEVQSNVYYAATQYGAGVKGSTAIKLASLDNAATLGGYLVDTNPLPTNGCRDRATSVCVTDAQIVSEINRDVTATGWSGSQPTATGNHTFFMFTAKGVGSCFGSSCSFTRFCAYHSNSGSLLYANMPYADTSPSACDAGYHPNASIDPDADATINVTSHENNETVTDPLGTAWYDSSGNEDGDKCAWTFGTVSGSANQTINDDHYILQQEWSNASSRCVLTGT